MASILAVDDEPANLDLLEAILSPAGHTVRAASGAIPALQAVREDPPDLILLDLMMPGMTGFEVCERLRMQEETARIPIILVTAAGLLKPEERAVIRLAADLITKPIVSDEVVSRVEEALRAAQLQQEMDRILAELFALEIRRQAHRQRALATLLTVSAVPGDSHPHGEPLLLISTEEAVREHYAALCAEHGLPLLTAAGAREGLEMATCSLGTVLLDLDLPGAAALPTLEAFMAQLPSVPVVALARTPLAPAASQAVRLGACDCIVKGLPPEWAVAAIHRALARRGTARTAERPPEACGRA